MCLQNIISKDGLSRFKKGYDVIFFICFNTVHPVPPCPLLLPILDIPLPPSHIPLFHLRFILPSLLFSLLLFHSSPPLSFRFLFSFSRLLPSPLLLVLPFFFTPSPSPAGYRFCCMFPPPQIVKEILSTSRWIWIYCLPWVAISQDMPLRLSLSLHVLSLSSGSFFNSLPSYFSCTTVSHFFFHSQHEELIYSGAVSSYSFTSVFTECDFCFFLSGYIRVFAV